MNEFMEIALKVYNLICLDPSVCQLI